MTLLAKAYMEGLFPRAIKGEIFFEKDLETEAGYVYFQPDYYEKVLIRQINSSEMLAKIRNSNASSSWLELIAVLNNAEEVFDIDLGQLELYTIVDSNFSISEYSNERLEAILKNQAKDELYKSLESDFKNLFPVLDFDVFRQDGILRATFRLPIKGDLEQRFEFYPIIKILNKHNQSVSNIKLYKGANANSIYFAVFF
jgi:hypothetical protein